jgi:hypothetical protein
VSPRLTRGVRNATRCVAVLSIACLLIAAAARNANAAGSKPIGGQRALAVSVPADPVQIAAGERGKALVRIVNSSATAIGVTVQSRRLSLLDNGKVAIGARPDARWQRRARFPSRQLRIPAQGYRDIPLTMRVPRTLPPDLYFVGFLVTPVPTKSGSIQVINQIGSFVTIDVPGPRDRELAGKFDIPSLVFGSQADGALHVTNTGKAAVRFWGEDDTNSSPGGKPQQLRLEPSLLPVGRSRSTTVAGKPAWPIGIVTVTAHITYPGRTEAATKELTFSKRVVVISPWVPVGLGLLALAAASGWWVRRRRNVLRTNVSTTAT